MFELHQLRCFVVVAEELHFGRAAARLHMTQPPLSRQIQLLEQQLSAQLFERSSRSVKMTRAGRAFLAESRAILRLAENASLGARRVAHGDAGTVTVGFTASSGYRFLPGLIATCRKRLPDVDLALKEMVTAEQIEALASGRLDVALMRPQSSNEDFESLCVAQEPLVAALPENHALARGRLPCLAHCDHPPFAMDSHLEARYFPDLVPSTFFQARVATVYPRTMRHIRTGLPLFA